MTKIKLPTSKEAERAVIGSVLMNNAYLDNSTLRPEDFYYKDNQNVWDQIQRLHRNKTPVDLVTLVEAVEESGLAQEVGGVDKILDYTSQLATATHFKHYERIVLDSKKRREVIKAAKLAIENAANDEKPVSDTLNSFTESLQKARGDEFGLVLMSEYREEIKTSYESWGKVTGLSTGYTKLDMMAKGLVGGELIVVGGATSNGKTALGINIANNIAKMKRKVLFVTLEMTQVELGKRFAFINDGMEGFDKVADYLVLQQQDELNWKSVDGLMKKAAKDFNVDLVVIDHLHYFTRELNNVAEELGNITKEFKKNAIRYKLPVILLSHTRKGSSKKSTKTGMDDLRGSSYIAQDADIVFMVERDQQTPDKIGVSIHKNRNRGFDPADNEWHFDFEQTKITEVLSPGSRAVPVQQEVPDEKEQSPETISLL